MRGAEGPHLVRRRSESHQNIQLTRTGSGTLFPPASILRSGRHGTPFRCQHRSEHFFFQTKVLLAARAISSVRASTRAAKAFLLSDCSKQKTFAALKYILFTESEKVFVCGILVRRKQQSSMDAFRRLCCAYFSTFEETGRHKSRRHGH